MTVPTAAAPGRDTGTVQTLQRGLQVLEMIVAAAEPVRLADVARELEMDRASAFRLLQTLERNGFVTKDPKGKRYAVGGKLLAWTTAMSEEVGLIRVARPYLQRIVRDTNESAHLGVLSHDQALLLDYIGSESMVVVKNRVGVHEPLHCTALGKALLAVQPEERRRDLLGRGPFRRYTARTVTDPAAFAQVLDEVRRVGVALDDGEYDEMLYCVASPVLAADGSPLAAIGVSIVHPLAVQRPEHLAHVREHVRRHARALTAAIAGEAVAARVFDAGSGEVG
jgi:DNA-binding IclR family transcriptional regulator